MMTPSLSMYWGRQLAIAAAVSYLAASQLATPAIGQSREELKQPLYRISKSDDRTNLPGEAVTKPTAPAVNSEPESAALQTAPASPPAPDRQLSLAEQTMNQALADAEVMLAHIRADVRDYTAILVKRENINGQVIGPEYVQLKVRNRRVSNGQITVPLSVYMKFLKPDQFKGREAIYVEGRNNNKLLAKEGGLRGKFMPSVWLPPTGRFAMKGNRYPITEVGIETLTQRLLERARADRSIDECIVKYTTGATVCGRPCKLLEVKRPTPKTGEAAKYGMNVYLARVFVDEELNVPIRYAAYGWPATEGSRPPIDEEYTYQNMQLNVGLTDADFDRDNPKYHF